MSKWFTMKAAGKAKKEANIAIFSDIGLFGVTAQDFHDQLAALGNPDTLNVTISSNGGDVAQGFAIYNMLARHSAHKVVTVEGLAASMASVIAMAGDEIVMPENAMLMIHNPWGSIGGEADQIASFADALKTMQANIVAAYKKRTGLPEDVIAGMMDRETWLGADKAVALGFADSMADPVKMAASFDLKRFEHVPEGFAKGLAPAAKRKRKDISASTNQESNMPKAQENAAVEEDMDFDTPAPKTEEEIRAELLGYQKEVRAVCKLASMEDLADGFIEKNTAVKDVIAALEEERKKKAPAGTDVSARNNARNTSGEPAPVIDPMAIFAKWNAAGKKRA